MRFFNSFGRCHFRTAVVVLLVLFGLAASASPSVGDAVDSQSVEINLHGIPSPYSFHRFCRPVDNELWVVGGNGAVKHTNRTGTTEQQITDKSLNGINFVTTNVGWIVGDNGTILFTKDRGSNWERQNSFVTNDIQAITCVNESTCWAVGNDGLILRTVDQGMHWRIVKAGTWAFLSAVSFVDGQIGWVVGEKGLIFRTIDGGESWEQQRVIIPLFPDGPFAQPTDLRAVKFVDKNRGWIAGTGGVARTLDGGRTWEVKELGHTALIGVVTIDGVIVWAISNEGRNYLSKDGGVTWMRMSRVGTMGTVAGNVLDQNGGVILIPDPVVVLRRKRKVTKVTVNENGRFEASLPSGTYEVTTEIPGFYPFRRAPFRVDGGTSIMINLVPSQRYLMRGTTVSIKNGVDKKAPRPRYEQFRVMPKLPLPGLIQFEIRQNVGQQVRYRFAVFSHNHVTVYADEILLDPKAPRLTASGKSVIIEDGKQRTEVKGVAVSFDSGEARLEVIKE